MDLEFHYYITHILAEKAGFSRIDAHRIAYSSQLVDDNRDVLRVDLGARGIFINPLSQTYDLGKPEEELKLIHPLFHFLPGEKGSAGSRRRDGKEHDNHFNTIPDSENSRRLLKAALASGNPYRIGIAVHVYADAWAHQNFTGLKETFNWVGSDALEKRSTNQTEPVVCHSQVLKAPDRVGEIWADRRLVDETVDNNERFLQAAENIYFAFLAHTEKDQEWEGLERRIAAAMSMKREDRLEAYRDICAMEDYEETEECGYAWRSQALTEQNNGREGLHSPKEGFEKSHWFLFQREVNRHRARALNLLKELYPDEDRRVSASETR